MSEGPKPREPWRANYLPAPACFALDHEIYKGGERHALGVFVDKFREAP